MNYIFWVSTFAFLYQAMSNIANQILDNGIGYSVLDYKNIGYRYRVRISNRHSPALNSGIFSRISPIKWSGWGTYVVLNGWIIFWFKISDYLSLVHTVYSDYLNQYKLKSNFSTYFVVLNNTISTCGMQTHFCTNVSYLIKKHFKLKIIRP